MFKFRNLKKFLYVWVAFIFVHCENPIQALNNHVIHAPKVIWQGQNGEQCIALSAAPKGALLSFVVQNTNASNRSNEGFHENSTRIHRLVIMDLGSMKTKYQFEFVKASLSNLTWSSDGKYLLLLKNEQLMMFASNTDSITPISLPDQDHLKLVRWGPSPHTIAFLIYSGNKVKQGLFNKDSHISRVIKTNLPDNIIDFSWSRDGKYVSFCVNDSIFIYYYKSQTNTLISKIRKPIKASLFHWMRENSEIISKVGNFALFKSLNEIGIFYLRTNDWQVIGGLQPEMIQDVCWASNGQNIFYALEENGNQSKIISEQILYVNP